jgi:hypothetical protein
MLFFTWYTIAKVLARIQIVCCNKIYPWNFFHSCIKLHSVGIFISSMYSVCTYICLNILNYQNRDTLHVQKNLGSCSSVLLGKYLIP